MDEEYEIDEEMEVTEEQQETDSVSDEEEGFMKGYSEDDESEECAECGAAIILEKKIVKTINEEKCVFCSKSCASDYEESLKEE